MSTARPVLGVICCQRTVGSEPAQAVMERYVRAAMRYADVAALLIPSLACVLWMTVFGGTAISQVVQQGYEAAAGAELPLQLFAMLDVLPLAQISSFIAIILVVVFFVTSSDSGSLVIDTIAAGGKVDVPVAQRVFWCTFEGLVAIALVLGGGLVALQAMAVSTGLPFTIVLLVGCVSIVKGLMSEPR